MRSNVDGHPPVICPPGMVRKAKTPLVEEWVADHNWPMVRPVTSSAAGREILYSAGLRMRAIRMHAGISQGHLCRVLQIDQSTYSRWELGKRAPDVMTLIAFCTRFRCSLDFIYRGTPVGLHPALLEILLKNDPDLIVALPTDMVASKDTARSAYRGSIAFDPVG